MKKITLVAIMLMSFLTWGIAQNAWINELHYDNASGDVNEMVEIVIENAGTYTLSDFAVYNYNGSNGTTYGNKTVDNFITGATVGNFTIYHFVFPANGMQNGAPDGLALVYQGTVITGQFLSYEGSLTATDGPANGMTSTDIGVSEGGGTAIGESLQLLGSGSVYGDFVWQAPATETPGAENNSQTLGGTASAAAPTFNPTAGTYYSTQNVTLSTTTPGMDIYYTTNGTDPDNGSTLYAAPINVATSTTIKAIAIDPTATLADSPISTGVYTISSAVVISDLATLRTQAQDGTIYTLTSEAIVTFTQGYRNQKFVQDATAGILIDDNSGNLTSPYTVGDGITGITGTLTSYKGMLQFVPQIDAGAATSTGNSVSPKVISATEFNNNFEAYEGQLVKLVNLTFADAGANFANGNVYATTDGNGVALDFRTSFYSVDYIGTPIPAGENVVIGIANERDFPYLTARDAADFSPYAPVIPINSMGIIIAGLFMAAFILVRKGRLF